MDAQAKNKALFRAKLNAQKQEKQRIDSPLARYNEQDQLVCRVCDVVIKSESLWPAHQASRKHHEAINNLKANAAALNQANSSKPIPPKELPKSKSEHYQELHKKSEPSTVLHAPRSSSSLPPDFFDNHAAKKQKSERNFGKLGLPDIHTKTDLISGNTQVVEPYVLGSETDGSSMKSVEMRDSEIQASKEARQGSKVAVKSEVKQVKGALPEGFFDDQDADLCARGITPVKLDVKCIFSSLPVQLHDFDTLCTILNYFNSFKLNILQMMPQGTPLFGTINYEVIVSGGSCFPNS